MLTAPKEGPGLFKIILYKLLVKLEITPLDKYSAKKCSLPRWETAIELKLFNTYMFVARCKKE